MGPEYEIVKRGTFEIGYIIEAYDYGDEGIRYSWRAGDGDESDVFFETAEDAEDDVRTRYGA